jgi:hypothetical protein
MADDVQDVRCPICKRPAQEVGRIGEATGFICPIHKNFKVADAVLASQWIKDCTRGEWQAALAKAKKRTKPMGWPLITSDDF